MALRKQKGLTSAEVAKDFLELMYKLNTPELPFRPGQFYSEAWEDFDVKKNLDILLDKRKSFFAHKETVFAGFRAWLLSPHYVSSRGTPPETNRQGAVQNAEALAALAMLAKRERSMFDGDYKTVKLLADINLRYRVIGPYFFEEIYYPIGGVQAARRTSPVQSFQRRLERGARDIETALWIMRIYHHHQANLQNKKNAYRPTSVKTASGLVSTASQSSRGRNERQNTQIFTNHKHAIALLYAASSMRLEKESTLLSTLWSPSASYRSQQNFLPELVGRARWVALEILANSAQDRTGALHTLPEVAPIQVAPPDFNSDISSAITKAFQR